MSLQEQLDHLYENEQALLDQQGKVLQEQHLLIPKYLTYLAERTGMTPERILACARTATTENNSLYTVLLQIVIFYQNDEIFTEKHKGDIPA